MSDATLALGPVHPASTRRLGIEAGRIVAVFGVIWFHMQAPGWRSAYAALGFFVMVAVVFAVFSVARQGASGYLRARWWRLAGPWLFWSAVYLALNALRLRDLVAALTPQTGRAFLIGPSLHLWVLPFLLIASALVAAVEPRSRGPRGLAALFLVGAPISIASFWAQTFVLPPAPFAQWAYALPCVCYALLFARAKGGEAGRLGDFAPPAFAAAVAAISTLLGATEDVGQFLLAALALELVWRIEPPRADWIAAAGGCAFGVYLVHPFILLIYHKFLADAGHTPQAVILVFAASLAVTLALKRAPIARKFL